MIITFTVPTIPIAQPRQRHRVLTIAGRAIAQNYTPTNSPVNAFKAAVQMALRESYDGPPLEGPLCATIGFVLPRPKSMLWKKREMPRAPHTGKPDVDNLYKSLVDSLEGLVFRNDSQLFHCVLSKYIAAGDEQPCVEVTIQKWRE